MKKILNEKGVVTGLLPKSEVEAMKVAYENGGTAYVYRSSGWDELLYEPNWNHKYVYKVEYEEKEMIPYDKNDIHKLFLDNTVVKLKSTGVETRIRSFDPSEAMDIVFMNSWISLKVFLEEYTHQDGSKFKKESV